MSKRMTVIFNDEELYRALNIEAARQNRPAKDIIGEAVREWLDSREDADLANVIEEARAEWREQRGVEASEFFARLKEGDTP